MIKKDARTTYYRKEKCTKWSSVKHISLRFNKDEKRSIIERVVAAVVVVIPGNSY